MNLELSIMNYEWRKMGSVPVEKSEWPQRATENTQRTTEKKSSVALHCFLDVAILK
jgi:hypothetical protein